jgi:hypothetical protein
VVSAVHHLVVLHGVVVLRICGECAGGGVSVVFVVSPGRLAVRHLVALFVIRCFSIFTVCFV